MPKGDVPGEWYAPTQPHPPASLMYGRNALNEGRPDRLHAGAAGAGAEADRERYKWYPTGVVYNPPIVGNVNGLLGAINMGNANGGTNWPGGGYDPDTHTGVRAGGDGARSPPSRSRRRPQGFSDLAYQAGVVGQPFRCVKRPARAPTRTSPQPAAAAGTRLGAVAVGAPPAPAPRLPAGSGGEAGDLPQGRRPGAAAAKERPDRPGALDRQAAVRRARGHRSREGRDQMARAAWRYAGRRAQSPVAQGDDDPARRGRVRQRRARDHEDARRPRRSAGHHDHRASARRDAARLRQGRRARKSARSSCRRRRAARR